MLKFRSAFLAGCLVLTIGGCTTSGAASAVTRIDASSVGAAEASYKVMAKRLPHSKQVELALAVLAINMIGVNSAAEAMSDPGLESPSIARIKDRVAGMSAAEIIDYAAKHSTIRMEVGRQ
jgi:hypothetical protein